jgi:hypothetical protein
LSPHWNSKKIKELGQRTTGSLPVLSQEAPFVEIFPKPEIL